jgi:hypothetical protein
MYCYRACLAQLPLDVVHSIAGHLSQKDRVREHPLGLQDGTPFPACKVACINKADIAPCRQALHRRALPSSLSC